MFGARRLVTLGSESIGPVSRRIEQNLTRPKLDGGELRAQENLIRVLAIVAAAQSEGRSVYFALLDKLLTAISAGAQPPVWRTEFAASQFFEAHAPPTANHSLAWLVESAAEPMIWVDGIHNRFVRAGDLTQGAANPLDGELQDRFAERLGRLRDASDGVWRQELQLAAGFWADRRAARAGQGVRGQYIAQKDRVRAIHRLLGKPIPSPGRPTRGCWRLTARIECAYGTPPTVR